MSLRTISFVAGFILLCPLNVLVGQDATAIQASGASRADAQTSTRLGPRKGTLRTVNGIQTETVVNTSGIRVYLYSAAGQQIAVGSGRGIATVSVEGNAKRYRYDFVPAEDQSLKVDVDFSHIAGRQISVDIQLVGIAATGAERFAYSDVATVPADQAEVDAIAIERQKICPVSGKPLGSMGAPVAVDVDGQRLFVCCAGCTNTVTANPTKYLSSRPKVEIVAATRADATLIAKQAKCPVMDELLGSMGEPIKLLVAGKPIFLCCKGCIKKVQAEPERYLVAVHGKPSAAAVTAGTDAVRPGVFKVTAVDKPFIAAQKRCPVMDEPLDAMGGPFKVNAAGKAIYICCPGCAKKIAAEPTKYLAILNQQGVEAPMLK